MNICKLKICGIRDVTTAHRAALIGIDYAGLVFDPSSRRYINPKQARDITTALQKTHTKVIAVFVNHTANEMLEICKFSKIHIVQLHGAIARKQHHLLPNEFQRIYVNAIADDGSILPDNDNGLKHCDPNRDILLFDNIQPGCGKLLNLTQFCHQVSFPFFLAGGININNIDSIINNFQPDGIDISSGVENSMGLKDISKIENIINKLRGAAHHEV